MATYLSYIETLSDNKVDVIKMAEEFNTHIKNHPGVVRVTNKANVVIHSLFAVTFDNAGVMAMIKESMPYTHLAIQQLRDNHGIIDVTFRTLPPLTAYKWHTDFPGKPFYHIPIISNEGCWFVYEGKSFAMPADGSSYKVNNSRLHTFMNAGVQERTHLVCQF